MISENIFWDSKPRYNLIEYEERYNLTIGFEGKHGLYPFSEIIHDHDNMLVPDIQGWVVVHKIHSPLGEGTDNNHWVKRGWV
jgi:hypothetical protein